MKELKQRFSGIIVPVILILCSLWSSAAAEMDARTKAEADGLAKYLAPFPMYLDGLLAPSGFTPPRELGWDRWSALYKLRYAWSSAEEGKTGNGQVLFARIADGVAERSEAVQSQAELRGLFGKADPLTPIEFARPPPTLPDLPAELREPVRKLAQYLEHSPYGSMEVVLTAKLGLSPNIADAVIGSSKTYAEIFERGVASISDPAVREQKLTSLAREVFKQSESACYEPNLARFPHDSSAGPTPEANPVNPNVPNRGVGDGVTRPRAVQRPAVVGANPMRATSDYTRFYNRHYGTPSSGSFARMAVSARGFGGIVFGNRVAVSTNFPPMRKLAFENLGTNDDGALVVTFATGAQSRLIGVSKEAVVAAYQMIYDPPAGLPSPALTNGTGMVGVLDNVPFAELDTSNRVVMGSQFKVVLHPSLQNLDLGWAFLMVDVTPINGAILDSAIVAARGTNAAATIRALWGSLDREDSQSTWKVVDVPMAITWADTNRAWLDVRRTASKTGDYPLGLRLSAFIEMWPILDSADLESNATNWLALLRGSSVENDRVDLDFASRFYRLLPVLTASSIDYYKVNQFARVLALVRWAKHQGAEFVSDSLPKPVKNVPTPEWIRISEKGVQAIGPSTNLTATIRGTCDEIDALVQRLLRDHEEVRTYAARYDDLIKRQEAAGKRMWDADSGSDQEAAAERELTALKEELAKVLKSESSQVVEAYRKLRVLQQSMELRLALSGLAEDTEPER